MCSFKSILESSSIETLWKVIESSISTYQRTRIVLDDWTLFLALSDAYEDNGDLKTASGLRWIYNNSKLPMSTNVNDYYYIIGFDNEVFPECHIDSVDIFNRMSLLKNDRVVRSSVGCSIRFKSFREAILGLANSVE